MVRLSRVSTFLLIALLGCCHAPGSASGTSDVSNRTGAGATQAGADVPNRTGPDAGASTALPPTAPDAGTALADACRSDDDCRTTPFPAEGCCRLSCTPRAVSTATFLREDAARRSCDPSRCVQLPCRPESARVRAACESGHCVLRHTSISPRD